MYPLTENIPKALLRLGGKKVIDYIIEQVNTLPDVNEIIVISNNKFIKHFKEWQEEAQQVSAIPINLMDDGSMSVDDRIGAIGDIYFALMLNNITEDIVVIAGDNYMTYPLIDQYYYFKEKDADTVCACRLDDREKLKAFAVAMLDEDGLVIDLTEKPENPQSDIAIFATYFYKADTLDLFDAYLMDDQPMDSPGNFPAWLYKRKDLYAYIMNGECYDIGTIREYDEVRKMLEKRS
jgi:glucose-1-phosphate thymidylyltransferase